MGYEKFTKKRRVVKDAPMITILKGGNLGINMACYEKFFQDFKYVILFYDSERRMVGVQPTNDASNDAYNIRLSRDGRLVNVSAISFLKYYKITHKESKAYPATWNDEDKLVELDIG